MGSKINNWIRSTLGEICEINMGQSPPSSTYNSDGIGLPFYQGVRDFGRKYPKPSVFCSKPHKIAELGDVLVSVRAPIGEANVASEGCCIGRGVAALRFKEGSNEFLFQLMRYIKPYWKKMFEEKGTVFGCVAREDIRSFTVTIPKNLGERLKITEILGSLDNKIELNDQINHTLEEMATATFRSWFVDFEPFLNGEFEYNEELDKEIPKGWGVKSVGEIVDYVSLGKTPKAMEYTESGYKIIKFRDVKEDGTMNWGKKENGFVPIENTPRNMRELQLGDILITASAHFSYLVGKKRAYVHFIPKQSEKVFFTGELLVVRGNNGIDPRYLYLYFKSNYGDQQIEHHKVELHLTNKPAKKMKVLVPPPNVLDSFVSTIELWFDMIRSNTEENWYLEEIRNTLLPKLLSGEIRVGAKT